MSEGTQAIIKYFTPSKGSGNKSTIGEHRTIVVDDNALQVAGFYEFTRMIDGKPVPAPSRFTMLIVKRDGEWLYPIIILRHTCNPSSKRMPRGPKGERRPANVIGNAVQVVRIATGEIEEKLDAAPKKKNQAVGELIEQSIQFPSQPFGEPG